MHHLLRRLRAKVCSSDRNGAWRAEDFDAPLDLLVTVYVAEHSARHRRIWDELQAKAESDLVIRIDGGREGTIYIDVDKVRQALSNNALAAMLSDGGEDFDYHKEKISAKGHLKGGKQSIRDPDFGVLDPAMLKWWHKKKQSDGLTDIRTREEALAFREEYEQELESLRRLSVLARSIQKLEPGVAAWYWSALRISSYALYQ